VTLPLQHRRYTVEEYLRLDNESDEKHEYWDGFIVPLSQLIAMAGGTFEHSLITTNFTSALNARLKGGPCRVMGSDLRIKVPRSPFYLYPDASVICDPPLFDPQAGGRTTVLNPRVAVYLYPDASVICDPPLFDPQAGGRTTVLNPRVAVEVLSPSTEAYDRGKKLQRYLQIPSLEEYVLIAQAEPSIDTYFRHPDGSWTFSVAYGLDATVTLRSLGVSVPLGEVYANVDFPPPQIPAIS